MTEIVRDGYDSIVDVQEPDEKMGFEWMLARSI